MSQMLEQGVNPGNLGLSPDTELLVPMRITITMIGIQVTDGMYHGPFFFFWHFVFSFAEKETVDFWCSNSEGNDSFIEQPAEEKTIINVADKC